MQLFYMLINQQEVDLDLYNLKILDMNCYIFLLFVKNWETQKIYNLAMTW